MGARYFIGGVGAAALVMIPSAAGAQSQDLLPVLLRNERVTISLDTFTQRTLTPWVFVARFVHQYRQQQPLVVARGSYSVAFGEREIDCLHMTTGLLRQVSVDDDGIVVDSVETPGFPQVDPANSTELAVVQRACALLRAGASHTSPWVQIASFADSSASVDTLELSQTRSGLRSIALRTDLLSASLRTPAKVAIVRYYDTDCDHLTWRPTGTSDVREDERRSYTSVSNAPALSPPRDSVQRLALAFACQLLAARDTATPRLPSWLTSEQVARLSQLPRARLRPLAEALEFVGTMREGFDFRAAGSLHPRSPRDYLGTRLATWLFVHRLLGHQPSCAQVRPTAITCEYTLRYLPDAIGTDLLEARPVAVRLLFTDSVAVEVRATFWRPLLFRDGEGGLDENLQAWFTLLFGEPRDTTVLTTRALLWPGPEALVVREVTSDAARLGYVRWSWITPASGRLRRARVPN